MKINGIGTISKEEAMKFLTREGREAVKAGEITTEELGQMYKLEQVEKSSRIGRNGDTFQASYKWIPDDLKEQLTPEQLGKLTDAFYECYGAGKLVSGHLLEEAQTKLANVEHQLETAKAELSGKTERLAELNAPLNMDEKGDEKKIEDYNDLSNEELMEKIHNMENEKGISLGRAISNCCDRNEMKALIECINCEDSVLDEYLNMIQPIYPTIYKKAVTNPNWKSSAERLQIFGAARQLLDQSAIQADKILQNDKVEGVRLPGC